MSLSPSLRFRVLRRDGFRCTYCGASASDANLVVDHVLARALGGTDDIENLVAACELCNAGKSASPLIRGEDGVLYNPGCDHWHESCGPTSRLNGWTGSGCGEPAVARVREDRGWRCLEHARRELAYRHLASRYGDWIERNKDDCIFNAETLWWCMYMGTFCLCSGALERPDEYCDGDVNGDCRAVASLLRRFEVGTHR